MDWRDIAFIAAAAACKGFGMDALACLVCALWIATSFVKR